MNKQRIHKMVNDLFYDIVETDEVREQKEELRIHLSERVKDYMAEGYGFEDALDAAKKGLGNPQELVSGFERKRAVEWDEFDEDYGVNVRFRISRLFTKLTPLAPFIYILLGVSQSTWMAWLPWDLPNWWFWGWVIIPVIPILSSGIGLYTLPAVAPFIYVVIGLFNIYGWQWWAWGWIIIPIAGILSTGSKKKKKKKKWKRVISVDVVGDLNESRKSINEAPEETKKDFRDSDDRRN
jgi:hypothetical protein